LTERYFSFTSYSFLGTGNRKAGEGITDFECRIWRQET